ncbi:MAG TPA: DUF1697 domain-containing protein [Solirubrobacteraceae bacterium]|nr:DUF1697 domain-containing protein [Solirubrobacteraceae bacterium]
MSGYVAFLRGMNVGGHRISNDELHGRFEELGFRDVSTFRASGNVIFATAPEALTKMTIRIEAGLAASLGYEVPVFLRTASEVRTIAAHQAFAQSLVTASKGKLQVAMLSKRPTGRARKEVLSLATDEDRLAFGRRELHWLPSGGILDSALDFKAIGKLLGPMTTRTKGTVEQVAVKYFPLSAARSGRSS